jgi:membrane-associated phospholipid phosphatase
VNTVSDDGYCLAGIFLKWHGSSQDFSLLIDTLFSTEPIIELQNAIGAEWETAVHGISLLGDSRLILVLAVMLFWYMAKHRPYQVLAASLLGAALGSILKLIFNQARPADPELLIYSTTTSPSFPSGHVVLATCFWGTLAWYGWIPRWVAGVIVGLVMFTRVYLGAHFIGDVIFGALVGLLWLAIFHKWIGPLLERLNPRKVSTVVAIAMAGSFLVLPITSTFPFGWEIVGGLVGAGIGLIVQEARVGFTPQTVSRGWQLAKIPVGALGIVLVILADVFMGQEIMVVELSLYFLAAIWGLLLAPWIFQKLGLGTSTPDPAA